MYHKDRSPSFFFRERDLDFPVESARAQKCRIKHIYPVGGCDHPHFTSILKTVKLSKQLHHGPVDLFRSIITLHPRTAHCVYFIDKNYGRRFFLSDLEYLSDKPRPFTQILMNELGSREFYEGRV